MSERGREGEEREGEGRRGWTYQLRFATRTLWRIETYVVTSLLCLYTASQLRVALRNPEILEGRKGVLRAGRAYEEWREGIPLSETGRVWYAIRTNCSDMNISPKDRVGRLIAPLLDFALTVKLPPIKNLFLPEWSKWQVPQGEGEDVFWFYSTSIKVVACGRWRIFSGAPQGGKFAIYQTKLCFRTFISLYKYRC